MMDEEEKELNKAHTEELWAMAPVAARATTKVVNCMVEIVGIGVQLVKEVEIL